MLWLTHQLCRFFSIRLKQVLVAGFLSNLNLNKLFMCIIIKTGQIFKPTPVENNKILNWAQMSIKN